MIQKFLSRFDDKKLILSTTIWGLEIWGMWQPKKGLRKIFSNCIHCSGVCFITSELVELYLIKSDMQLAMRNVSISLLSFVCVIKTGCFVLWQKEWKKIIDYVFELEKKQIEKNDEVTNKHLRGCRIYSRILTYFYGTLVTATVWMVILAPLFGYMTSPVQRELIRNGSAPYPEIVSSWLPFDRTRGYGYVASVFIHCWHCLYGAGIVANFDSNTIVIMSFFATQFKILNDNCERLFDGVDTGYENEVKRIKECHDHHVQLVKHANILNRLLSPVMFLYVIICSLMICASAIQLTLDEATLAQRIWTTEYILALIAQLFLYCWHSNEILIESEKVNEGVYRSEWWLRCVKTRKAVLLLGGQLRKSIVFTAGPFTELTLATFVTILKGSYSYYTLLSQNKD